MVFRAGKKRVIVECKNAQSWAYGKLLGYVGEAVTESANYSIRRNIDGEDVHPVVFLKQHNKSWRQGVAMLPIAEYLRLVGEA